ncbi:MAG: hypothetical protein GC137_04755 [Alphaproteobacteria bacterium]|nr:hypothetical protein [Alphaproteobacteria bacterium]
MSITDKIKRKFLQSESGFSLVEMASVIVIIGALLVPTLLLLENYKREEKVENNKDKLSNIVRHITNFENVYGYYPLPASGFASSGDLEYGHAISSPASAPYGTCSNGVCHIASVAGNPAEGVIIGVIPFKTMSLPEEDAYDEYGSRIIYAVSRSLTDPATFDPNGGVIEILDENAESVVTPPASVNFLVLSHGANRIGATTKQGFSVATLCSQATSVVEALNCDHVDGIFGLKLKGADFDDDVAYYNSLSVQHWQKIQGEPNIHSKLDALSIGGSQGQTMPNTAALSVVRQVGGSTTGTIYASGPVDTGVEVSSSVDGLFLANDLCNGANCFRPDSLAGMPTLDLATGLYYKDGPTDDGMSCYTPGNPIQYMVGIEGGEPKCESEVFVVCPDTVITGFDSEGNVICADQPPLPCEDPITHTPYCGSPTGPVTNTGTVPHGQFSYFYSGECTDFTDPLFDSNFHQFIVNQGWPGQTLAQAQAAVTNYNEVTGGRTSYFCGPSSATALVRDNFYCNDGTYEQWDSTERYNNPHYNGTLTSPTQGYPYNVENSYTGPLPPPAGQVGNHDCRCEENLRAVSVGCPAHTVGQGVAYGKHGCPQTADYWQYQYYDYSGCVCQPGPFSTPQSCHSYYNQVVSSPPGPAATSFNLLGNVQLTYNVDCSTGSPVVGPPTSVDTSQCNCPSPAPQVSPINCPAGTTNSWTSATQGPQTGKAALEITTWFCPETQSSGIEDPGYWNPVVIENGPACTCDTSLTDTVMRSCCWQPSGTTGVENPTPCNTLGQREWRRPYICAANPEDPAIPNPDTTTWTPTGYNTCQTCSWTNNGSPPVSSSAPSGSVPLNNTQCDCNGAPNGFCYIPNGSVSNQYSCNCVTNP